MKEFSKLIKVITLFMVAVGVLWSSKNAVWAANYLFTRPLKVGMSGEDVRELQKILNSNIQTQVQAIGHGSPGQETDYFGVLTRNAVIRFQEKYRDQVLTPNGLYSGTGYVGPSTLRVLARLPIPNTTPVSEKSAPVASSSNPNLVNLDKFLSAIDTVSAKQGISSQKVSLIKDQVMKDVATSTNLQESFVNLVKSVQAPSAEIQSHLFKKSLMDIVFSIKKIFSPKSAFAANGTPFGGALYYSFFCNCSANWLLTIQPLPPTYVTLLTYQTGSQAYLSYNIPYTRWLLGEYQTGAGQCLVYIGTGCATIASEGMVNSKVGSSPM